MLASAVGAGLLAGLALGGDVRRLATIELRWWRLFLLAIALRVLAVLPLGDDVQRVIYVVSLWSLFACIALNVRLPGARLAGLGVGLNAAAVSLAGGAMPVSPDAVVAAGVRPPVDPLHSLTPNASLLGDIIPIPILGVYSVGDVLLALG